MIGRQSLFINNKVINKIIYPKKTLLDKKDYWDELLVSCYKSTKVTNLDVSNYEGANLIANLNLKLKIKKNLIQLFNLVL